MALLATGLWAGGLVPALGQVMDIGPDGSTAIYKGPVLASAEGTHPLNPGPRAAKAPFAVTTAIQGAATRHVEDAHPPDGRRVNVEAYASALGKHVVDVAPLDGQARGGLVVP